MAWPARSAGGGCVGGCWWRGVVGCGRGLLGRLEEEKGKEEEERRGNGVRGGAPAKFLKRVFRAFPGLVGGSRGRF